MEYFDRELCADFLICSECATAGLNSRRPSHKWESEYNISEDHSRDNES